MKRKLSSLILAILLVGSLLSGSTAALASGADRDPYTVKIIAHGDGTTESCTAVAAELSKITLEKFNTTIELQKGYTKEQLNLVLTSGEKVDLFPVCSWEMNLANLASNGQILPIDDLLAEYGQETLNGISEEDWRCMRIGGSLYGVPANKDKALAFGALMRKDVVDELGIDYKNVKTPDDLEAVLMLVKEKKPDMYPLVSSFGTVTDWKKYDKPGDMFGMLEDCFDDSTTLVNYYESESFKEMVEQRYDWNQKGLIMPDATSNTEDARTIIGSGKGFCGLFNLKPGVENQETASMGTEVVAAEIIAPHSSSESVNSIAWVIPANSDQPERAMEVLDLLYNDPVASNIFINGVEGTHFVYADDTKQVIDYPEGKSGTTVGYTVVGWAGPNQQITPVRVGDPLDLWEQLNDFNANAVNSPIKGFTFDNSSVLNEYTACNNVKEKYEKVLLAGAVDPAETLPILAKELKEAGVDTIVAEKQRQLDEWLANN